MEHFEYVFSLYTTQYLALLSFASDLICADIDFKSPSSLLGSHSPVPSFLVGLFALMLSSICTFPIACSTGPEMLSSELELCSYWFVSKLGLEAYVEEIHYVHFEDDLDSISVSLSFSSYVRLFLFCLVYFLMY